MQAARAPRVYQWLTYDNDARKAQRSHKDVLELNEDGWVDNDPRFVAQDMSDFKYHVWDDIASFLAWYEDVEAVRRHYSAKSIASAFAPQVTDLAYDSELTPQEQIARL